MIAKCGNHLMDSSYRDGEKIFDFCVRANFLKKMRQNRHLYNYSSAVKLEASCLGALSLRLLCHSSNTFTAHLVLCWVFLGSVLSKRRRSSSSVFGGRNQRTPLSSSMSTFAIQMYHCKRLRQFKEIIARK